MTTTIFSVLLCTFCISINGADINAILSELSTEQKVGQMTQLEIGVFMDGGSLNREKLKEWISTYHIGSILNSPFSGGLIDGEVGWTAQQWRDIIVDIQEIAQNSTNIPILYGIDSIHGASYVYGSTLFPQVNFMSASSLFNPSCQQLATAATFNTDLARNCGKITAKDTRAAAIPWMFSPVLGIALNPLWARFWETFGEDPYLAARMGASIIEGMQEDPHDGGSPPRAAACMKHFISYSAPENGHDRAPVQLSDRSMKQIFLPSFQAAIDAGVMTAMESYNDVGGVPMVSSTEYLRDMLRLDMGFDGLLVTDWAEIENLHSWHKVAASQKEAVEIALMNTSIDMSMVPSDTSFFEYTLELLESGVISMERLDESVLRILTVKDALGLFDSPVPPRVDPLVATVGQDDDWTAALDTARESITLLKNTNGDVLPVSNADMSTGGVIFVTGPTSNSLVAQTGGWTFHWQGALDDSNFTRGVTVKQGLELVFSNATITYIPGPSFEAEDTSDVDMVAVANVAAGANLIVICVGEDTYTEKPGDIDDLLLSAGQIEYVKAIREATTAPIALVIISGRPRLLDGIADAADAVLNAYLPGPMGGQAIAEIIAGEVNPSGRMPYSYPKHSGLIPYPYHHKPSSQCNGGNGQCEVEWIFGTGLSYTSFAVSELSVSTPSLDENGDVTISVMVTNTGTRTGKYSVLMFLFDMYRRVSPEYKLLKRFTKVELAPGDNTVVQWTLSAAEDLKYIGIDGRYVLESGNYYVGVGPMTDCRANASETLCEAFELALSSDYNAVCSKACDMWSNGVCGDTVDEDVCAKQCREENWEWNYVDCLEDTMSGGCADWQCYDAFSLQDVSGLYYNNSDCGDNKFDYTNDDLVYATIISAMGGLAVGMAATWMALFGRYSLRKIHDHEEGRPLATTQSPIVGLGSGTSASTGEGMEEHKS